MQKSLLSAPRLAGLALTLLAALLSANWTFRVGLIDQLVPGSASIGLVNPLLFLAIGICLLEAKWTGSARARAALGKLVLVCIAALILLPLAHVFQTATGLTLGLDLARADAVATAANPIPGRLSLNASVAFMLTGLAFALLRSPLAGGRKALCMGAIIAVGVVGLVGLAGHFLGLETLYKFADFNRLLPTTAFGLAMASAGLWALFEESQPFDLAEAEQRIRSRSLAVIALVALGCGVAGFAIMRDTFEQSVAQNLRLTASTNAISLAHALDTSLWVPRTVGMRPGVRQAFARLGKAPNDAASRELLQRVGDSLLGGDLYRAEFHDAQGTLLMSVGAAPAEKGGLAHPLRNAGQTAWLAWRSGEYMLVSDNAIMDHARVVGRVVTEQKLPLFDRLLEEVRSVSATSDALICSREQAKALCAPTRFRPSIFDLSLVNTEGTTAQAIGEALQGRTGVLLVNDPRGQQVLAAYAPIKDFGLALGVKTDVDTLYAPLRQRVGFLALALAAMVALAIYSQLSQVQPVLMRLAASERKVKRILEEQTELVSLARPDGVLTYVNPAYARHFGLTPKTVVGANLFDHVDPADVEMVRTAIASVLESGIATTIENRMVRQDGAPRWVSWTNSLQRTRGGKPLLHSVGRDVTERRLAEERLASSERFLRQVTDSLPVRIAYADREGRCRFINLAHCRRFGLPRERILGRTRAELISTPADAQIEAAMAAVLEGSEQRLEVEEVVDGKTLRIESRMIPDFDENGEVRGFYSIGVDVTERSAAERALRDLATVFDNTTDYVVQTDWRGRIRYMNPAVRQALGMRPDEPLSGVDFDRFNTPETHRMFLQTILPVAKAKGVWIGETTVYVANRRMVHVNQMVIAHKGVDGRVNLYSSIMRDITDELAVEREQQRQAATLRSVAEAIPVIVSVVGKDLRYRFVNSGFERWSEMDRGAIVGRSLQEVLGRKEYEHRRPWVERALAGETVNFERDYPGRSVGRHLAINYIPLWLDNGEIDGFVAVAMDVTQHKQENVRLLQLSQRDPLTGLLNRLGFEAWLEAALKEESSTRSLALLYVDLDRFKPVNDTHGHAVGDHVLQQFAQRLQRLVRPTDAVARLGGDEFAIALAGIRDSAHADAVAEEVVEAARPEFEVAGLRLNIGASVGVALGTDAMTDWRELIARADQMLYRAKEAGRGRFANAARGRR